MKLSEILKLGKVIGVRLRVRVRFRVAKGKAGVKRNHGRE